MLQLPLQPNVNNTMNNFLLEREQGQISLWKSSRKMWNVASNRFERQNAEVSLENYSYLDSYKGEDYTFDTSTLLRGERFRFVDNGLNYDEKRNTGKNNILEEYLKVKKGFKYSSLLYLKNDFYFESRKSKNRLKILNNTDDEFNFYVGESRNGLQASVSNENNESLYLSISKSKNLLLFIKNPIKINSKFKIRILFYLYSSVIIINFNFNSIINNP